MEQKEKYNFWKDKVAPLMNPMLEEYEMEIFAQKMTHDEQVPFWKDERWTRFEKRNFETGHIFTGGNRILTFFQKDECFITKKGIERMGAVLKNNNPIQLLRPIFPYKKAGESEDEYKARIKKGAPIFFKLYEAYGTSNVDNLPEKQWEEDNKNIPDASVEEFISRICKDKGLKIENAASLSLQDNTIYIPDIKRYQSSELYYLDLFKSVALWAMIKNRMCKQEDIQTFSAPTLVSEMVSACICTAFNINILPDSSSYILQWIQVMKSDISILTSSSSKYEKVINFLKK